MKENPRISEAEFEVMKAVWEKYPITANELVGKLAPQKGWNPKTVKTLISRLMKKGVLAYRLEGKSYLYTPLVSRDECVSGEAESFLNRVFDGALMPMLAHFAQSKTLTEAEITALRQLLDREN